MKIYYKQSEVEAAPRYISWLYTVDTVGTVDMVYTVDTVSSTDPAHPLHKFTTQKK